CLAQRESVYSGPAKLHRVILSDLPSRRADTQGKQGHPLFLQAKDDIQRGHPCFFQLGSLIRLDVVFSRGSTLLDASRQASVTDRGVSGLRACRRNRESRRARYQTSDASNSASRDATKERLLLERIRLAVSCRPSAVTNRHYNSE